MEYSPSSTIETIEEDKDVYLYELNNLNNFNPLPPPPILDPYNYNGNNHGHSIHSGINGGLNHNNHNSLNPSNHIHPQIGYSNSPISNRQNSIQSSNSYPIDNDSQNNPSIFSNSNNSYNSIHDVDNSIYNLDYELGSFESIDSSINTPNHSFNNSFNSYSNHYNPNYFEYHNSNHVDSFDKEKFLSRNLSTTFSDVSPLNKYQEFTIESTPIHNNVNYSNINNTPKLPQLTTFHHHPSLPNLQLVNGEYDKGSQPSTPDSPIKTPVDFQLRRKKKSFNQINSPFNSPNLGISINGLGVSVETESPISTPAKKYTRRRLLPRSKNGCWICRIKHLKCDEIKPHCTSCVKYGINCDYSPDKPNYVVDKNLRNKKLIEITQIRKNNQKLRPKKSKKRLDD